MQRTAIPASLIRTPQPIPDSRSVQPQDPKARPPVRLICDRLHLIRMFCAWSASLPRKWNTDRTHPASNSIQSGCLELQASLLREGGEGIQPWPMSGSNSCLSAQSRAPLCHAHASRGSTLAAWPQNLRVRSRQGDQQPIHTCGSFRPVLTELTALLRTLRLLEGACRLAGANWSKPVLVLSPPYPRTCTVSHGTKWCYYWEVVGPPHRSIEDEARGFFQVSSVACEPGSRIPTGHAHNGPSGCRMLRAIAAGS